MTTRKPAVLFVCVKNGGKSQMAAGLMHQELKNQGRPDAVDISSAGTLPGKQINALSAEVLNEVGVDITGQRPTQLTEEAMLDAGHVVVLGAEAEVPELEGVTVERWITDEPSERGIEGRERMELVRGDIQRHVEELVARLV